jgi:hypothetical protein
MRNNKEAAMTTYRRDWWAMLAIHLLVLRGLIGVVCDVWRVLVWLLYY